MNEFKPSAAGIFLSSVHRSMESMAGERPKKNIVSSALCDRILTEGGFQMFVATSKEPNSLFGHPVLVVESKHLFAVSIDA